MSEEKHTKTKDYSPFLKQAISKFYEDRTQDSLLSVLAILADSFIWIPCNAVVGEKDQEQLEKMLQQAAESDEPLEGQTFTSQEAIRLVPDILQHVDKYYFPVFSSSEEMGEYGTHFSTIKKPFIEALAMAKNNQQYELAGIVVNAFTEPIELPWDLLKIIEDYKKA